MRKIILLLIAVAIFGCSSDGGTQESNASNSLIGKWTGEKETDYSSNGVFIKEFDYSKEECYHMTTYEFNTNNQFVSDSYDYDGKNCVRNTMRIYSYSYSNNTIIIDKTESIKVLENTNYTLKLKTINSDNSYTVTEYSKVN